MEALHTPREDFLRPASARGRPYHDGVDNVKKIGWTRLTAKIVPLLFETMPNVDNNLVATANALINQHQYKELASTVSYLRLRRYAATWRVYGNHVRLTWPLSVILGLALALALTLTLTLTLTLPLPMEG